MAIVRGPFVYSKMQRTAREESDARRKRAILLQQIAEKRKGKVLAGAASTYSNREPIDNLHHLEASSDDDSILEVPESHFGLQKKPSSSETTLVKDRQPLRRLRKAAPQKEEEIESVAEGLGALSMPHASGKASSTLTPKDRTCRGSALLDAGDNSRDEASGSRDQVDTEPLGSSQLHHLPLRSGDADEQSTRVSAVSKNRAEKASSNIEEPPISEGLILGDNKEFHLQIDVSQRLYAHQVCGMLRQACMHSISSSQTCSNCSNMQVHSSVPDLNHVLLAADRGCEMALVFALHAKRRHPW